MRTLTYDAANRLTQVVSGTLTTQFTYNGDGHRLRKVADGVTTTYVIALLPVLGAGTGGLPQVLVETTGGSSTAYLHGHDLLGEKDTAWTWHLNDGLGSVHQLTGGNSDVTQTQSYTPFGLLLWQEGNTATAYGFTGEQQDPAVALVFLRTRYYDPAAGRFLSKDPWPGNVWRPRMLNPYLYVLDNPINSTDPTGLKEWRPSTSWVERIVGRVYEQSRPEIHLEYSLPIGQWRPDILNSITGDVWEIKPFNMGVGVLLAEAEASIYAEALNQFKADTILGRKTGLLPQNDPNNWNTIYWHSGIGFPPLYIPGQTPIPTAYGSEYIEGPFDLVVLSSRPGSVTWFFVPKPTVSLAVIATWLAKDYWSKYVLGSTYLKDALMLTCPVIVAPEFLLDPNNPWNPINPNNCWKHPENCAAEPVQG
jgi:RHS repeat-associated protein